MKKALGKLRILFLLFRSSNLGTPVSQDDNGILEVCQIHILEALLIYHDSPQKLDAMYKLLTEIYRKQQLGTRRQYIE